MINENDPRWKALSTKEIKKGSCQTCHQEKWVAPVFFGFPSSTGETSISEWWMCWKCLESLKQYRDIIGKVNKGERLNMVPIEMEEAVREKNINSEWAEKAIFEVITSQQAKLEVKEMLDQV